MAFPDNETTVNQEWWAEDASRWAEARDAFRQYWEQRARDARTGGEAQGAAGIVSIPGGEPPGRMVTEAGQPTPENYETLTDPQVGGNYSFDPGATALGGPDNKEQEAQSASEAKSEGDVIFENHESAFRFGYSARRHYRTAYPNWTLTLEAQLSRDWENAYQNPEFAWRIYKDSVRRGWEYAESLPDAPAL